MNFKPNPLLYGVGEDFFSTFRLVITMRSSVEREALARSVEKAIARYPYFSVYPEKKDNSIILQFNKLPVPVFGDDRCAVLGTEESNGHLLTFGCLGQQIFLDVSHCIADGMGIDPLLKSVLYFYVSELYGSDGLNAERIKMPSDPVMAEEYDTPFFDEPFDVDDASYMPKKAPDEVYALDSNAFDADGLYAYHLHVPQKAMMAKANPSDGSPVSFLSVLLYRALCELDGALDLPVVAHVQHQYRAAVQAPVNRHSLVSYIPVALSPKMKAWAVERQNTVMRGQIIIGSETSSDLGAVNRLLEAFPSGDGVSLAEKKQAMHRYLDESILGKTFGISYVGKMDWCGLDRYVEDIHAYIGEKHTKNMLLIEVMTVGEDFTINLMQSGRGDRYVKAFVKQLKSFDIPVQIVGENRYNLCDTKIPD